MNADTFVIIAVLMFTVWGFVKGALKEIFSLLAYASAFFFSSPVTNVLLAFFKPAPANYMLIQSAGRVLVWFLLYLIIIFAGKFIESRFVKKRVLRLANRAGGGALGFLKAAMLAIALMWTADVFISLTNADTPDLFGKSRIYKEAVKKNLLMKTEKVKNLKKMIALAKLAEKRDALASARSGASDMADEALAGGVSAEVADALKDIDASQIEKLLEEMHAVFPDLKLPADMNIKKIQKLVSDMNKESVKKIRRAVK